MNWLKAHWYAGRHGLVLRKDKDKAWVALISYGTASHTRTFGRYVAYRPTKGKR